MNVLQIVFSSLVVALSFEYKISGICCSTKSGGFVTSQPKFCIINNNYMSSFMEVSIGVRQSEPISPQIYIIYAVFIKFLNARRYTGI